MQSVTSSFRISIDLHHRLSEAAKRSGKGKNRVLVDALTRYLEDLDNQKVALEARRQSELVSRNERGEDWYAMADTAGWR